MSNRDCGDFARLFWRAVRWVTTIPPVLDAEAFQHRQLLRHVIYCILITCIGAAVTSVVLANQDWDVATSAMVSILTAFLIGAGGLNRRGHYLLGALVVVTATAAIILYSPLMLRGGFDIWPLFYLVLPVLIGGMFLPVRLLAVLIGLGSGLLLLLAVRPDVRLDSLPVIFFLAISAVCLIMLRHLNALQRVRQQALEESRERFRQLLETVFEAIAVEEDGRIRETNPGFDRLFGCPAAGHACLDIRRFLPEWERMLAPGETGNEAETFRETVGMRIDGARIQLQYAISRLTNDKTRHMLALRDVSHERQLEMQYRQAQKMEAVGHLAGGVAHDFNNLLQAIMGYTEMAAAELGERHPARELLDKVGLASTRAAGLIHQLLSFSRREAMDHSTINLGHIVSELTSMLQRLLGEHIDLRTKLPSGLWNIQGDSGQMAQVLMNLCVNARDAMPAGGAITIEAENTMVDDLRRQQIGTHEDARCVHIAVRDTGIGMDAAVLEHIFEPFFTTKEIGRGTGLGLATVYGIVKQHRGHVEVESTPGAGTVFHIYLPASFGVEKVPLPQIMAPPPRGGAEHILVAEDDESVRTMVVTALKKAGYRVTVARDGLEAIAAFDANPEAIDLALLDVMMPRKSGRDAADAMKKIRPALPVLYSTGHDFNLLGAGFRPDENSAILRKPYIAAELLRQIRVMLDSKPV